MEYEADRRHRKEILDYFGLDVTSKGHLTNGRTEDDRKEHPGAGEHDLEEGDVTAFQGMAARINFLAQDSPELLFPAKEVCRDMSAPSVESWTRLKRLARYGDLGRCGVPLRVAGREQADEPVHGQRLGWMQEDPKVYEWRGDHDRNSLREGVEFHSGAHRLE